MTSKKLIEKIRAVIYNTTEGKFLKEEAFDKIEELMVFHNKLSRKINHGK